MKAVFQGSVVLTLLLAIAGGAVWALVTLVGLEASLVWGAIIGAIAWAVRTNVERRHEYQRLLADKKREQYYEFLDFWNQTFGVAGQPSHSVEDPEVIRKLRSWSLRLTMIGSDEVVRSWNDLRLFGGADDQPESDEAKRRSIEMMRLWGALWMAMRRDCGHSDTTLHPADVLRSIINDIDQYREHLKP
jgi:hypothetical protein